MRKETLSGPSLSLSYQLPQLCQIQLGYLPHLIHQSEHFLVSIRPLFFSPGFSLQGIRSEKYALKIADWLICSRFGEPKVAVVDHPVLIQRYLSFYV
jgi:hypothetical protein